MTNNKKTVLKNLRESLTQALKDCHRCEVELSQGGSSQENGLSLNEWKLEFMFWILPEHYIQPVSTAPESLPESLQILGDHCVTFEAEIKAERKPEEISEGLTPFKEYIPGESLILAEILFTMPLEWAGAFDDPPPPIVAQISGPDIAEWSLLKVRGKTL